MAAQMNRRAFLALSLSSALGLAACGNSSTTDTTSAPVEDTPADAEAEGTEETEYGKTVNGVLVTPLDNPYNTGTHHAKIEVEGYGTIELELNAKNTPITVSNFADLVESGFYDGLTFHRVIKGFMIQGGDPNGNGTGGSSRMIKGEFSENGVANFIQHKRGVISMARSSANDSASSQFFIVHEDSPHLDNAYAAFGKVTEGMDVVDAIAEKTPVEDTNGTVAPENQPKIKSIVMVD